MENERRKNKRFKKEFVVIFKDSDEDYFVKAVTKNISLGGMLLKIDSNIDLEVGQILKLQFLLEEYNEIIELTAIVKWIAEPDDSDIIQIGIEFSELDNPDMKDTKEKLKELLINA